MSQLVSCFSTPQEASFPLLSLVLQEHLAWLHRRLALLLAAQWKAGVINGTSKSLKTCRKFGLLPGLEGFYSRFLLARLLTAAGIPVDISPVVSVAPSLSYQPSLSTQSIGDSYDDPIYQELVAAHNGMGLPPAVASVIRDAMDADLQHVATEFAALQSKLQTLPGSPQAAEKTTCGHLYLLRGPGARGTDGSPSLPACSDEGLEPKLLLVYQPSTRDIDRWLQPVREDPLACIPLIDHCVYGPQTFPLYDVLSSSHDVETALTAAGIDTSIPFTSVLQLNLQHYEKLCLLYRLTAAGTSASASLPCTVSSDFLALPFAIAGKVCLASCSGRCLHLDDPAGPDLSSTLSCSSPPHVCFFLRRLFCMLARYETLFGNNASGLQGAIPPNVFEALEKATGRPVDGECFASPLNCHSQRFCSAFLDTDAPFGSLGSFFSFWPARGVYQLNPPWTLSHLNAAVRHVHSLLERASSANEALLFAVMVPAWRDASFLAALESSNYAVASPALLPAKAHHYIDGMQVIE